MRPRSRTATWWRTARISTSLSRSLTGSSRGNPNTVVTPRFGAQPKRTLPRLYRYCCSAASAPTPKSSTRSSGLGQVAWLTVDEAEHDMVEARAVRVTDALSDKGPFVRAHDGTWLPRSN